MSDQSVINLAVALERVSLEHRISLSPEDAYEYVGQALDYAACDALAMQRLVTGIGTHVPRVNFGMGDPSTGRTHHRIWVGNEGGRVLYVDVSKGYMTEGFDYKALELRLLFLAIDARAEDAEVQRNDARYWMFRYGWNRS